jgi:hypothetical protein
MDAWRREMCVYMQSFGIFEDGCMDGSDFFFFSVLMRGYLVRDATGKDMLLYVEDY